MQCIDPLLEMTFSEISQMLFQLILEVSMLWILVYFHSNLILCFGSETKKLVLSPEETLMLLNSTYKIDWT